MAAHFRTAFMAASGFSTATAPVAKPASPVKTSERKTTVKSRGAGRPTRDPKIDGRTAIEAA